MDRLAPKVEKLIADHIKSIPIEQAEDEVIDVLDTVEGILDALQEDLAADDADN